jgi:hypothetical protein
VDIADPGTKPAFFKVRAAMKSALTLGLGATRPRMLHLDDISDISDGPRAVERQQTAVTAATGGNALPPRLPRPFFNEETT